MVRASCIFLRQARDCTARNRLAAHLGFLLSEHRDLCSTDPKFEKRDRMMPAERADRRCLSSPLCKDLSKLVFALLIVKLKPESSSIRGTHIGTILL